MRAKDETQAGNRAKLFMALAALAVMAVLGAVFHETARQTVGAVLVWVREVGPLGYVVFALVYIVAVVLFIPGAFLTLAAGFLFGLVRGTVLTSVSSVTGASLAFLLGRFLARGAIAKRISDNERFAAIDDAVGHEGFKIVLLTRLSPVIPFNLQNYAYGLTKIGFWKYALASAIGMFPGTVMYVYLGTTFQSIAAIVSGKVQREKTPAEWALFGLGLVATIAVTFTVTRVARRALREATNSENDGDGAPGE